MKRDYYEVLEVSKDADDETIKRAYRRLAMQHHPDRNEGDKEAEARFREAAEAYDVLRDPKKRARYDRYGHAGLDESGLHHFDNTEDVMDVFGDLLSGIFGGSMGGGVRRGGAAGRDIQVAVELDLREAAHGVTRTIKVRREEACGDCGGDGARPGSKLAKCRRCGGRGMVIAGQGFFRVQQTCGACGGRGVVVSEPCLKCRGNGRVAVDHELQVAIPAGIDAGMSYRVEGHGHSGRGGGPPGDLHCVIEVRKHPLFTRDGVDLHCEVPITFSQAALGGPIEIPALEGNHLNHTLKKGTQSGEEVRILGRGVPHLDRYGRNDGRRGDLVIHFQVVTPRKLTKRQEELLRELSELDAQEVSPERRSWLDRVKAFFSANPTDGARNA